MASTDGQSAALNAFLEVLMASPAGLLNGKHQHRVGLRATKVSWFFCDFYLDIGADLGQRSALWN